MATNQPLWRYIVFAYKLSGTQELALRFSYFDGLKSKAPGWVTGGFDVSADRFNIEARAPDNSTIDEMRLMMQSLLADRFHLVVQHETRDAPAFGLVLVRPGATGLNLQPHPPCDTCPTSTPHAKQPLLLGSFPDAIILRWSRANKERFVNLPLPSQHGEKRSKADPPGLIA